MAQEIRDFQVLIPAGTAVDSPVTVDMAMPPRIVDQINIRIPPGPNGLMGFRLSSGGIPFLPSNSGAWVIANDEPIQWPLTGQITSGAWELQGYNLGQYDHTVYVKFLLSLVNSAAAGVPAQPLAVVGLSSAAPPVDLSTP